MTDMTPEPPTGANRFNGITQGWQQADDDRVEVSASKILKPSTFAFVRPSGSSLRSLPRCSPEGNSYVASI